MSALTPTSLPAPPITQPCSRPAPSAQPVEAPAPRPRSGIAGLPAHGLWPELTVTTGSSRSSFVHTALGYLCPSRHSQAVKQLWFGRTLTQYLVSVVTLVCDRDPKIQFTVYLTLSESIFSEFCYRQTFLVGNQKLVFEPQLSLWNNCFCNLILAKMLHGSPYKNLWKAKLGKLSGSCTLPSQEETGEDPVLSLFMCKVPCMPPRKSGLG